MIDRALDAGVNLIDTADVYANGQSEEILGAAIRDRRDAVLVATKVGFGSRERGALSYDAVISVCEDSLRRLGTDRIDLYQLHRPDRTTPIEETLRALDDLVAVVSYARPVPATSGPGRWPVRSRTSARSAALPSPRRRSTTRWSGGRRSTRSSRSAGPTTSG